MTKKLLELVLVTVTIFFSSMNRNMKVVRDKKHAFFYIYVKFVKIKVFGLQILQ